MGEKWGAMTQQMIEMIKQVVVVTQITFEI